MSKRKIKLTSVNVSFSNFLKAFGSPNVDVLDLCDDLGIVISTFVLNRASSRDRIVHDDKIFSTKYFSSIRTAKKHISRSIKASKKISKINKIPFIHIVNKEEGLK